MLKGDKQPQPHSHPVNPLSQPSRAISLPEPLARPREGGGILVSTNPPGFNQCASSGAPAGPNPAPATYTWTALVSTGKLQGTLRHATSLLHHTGAWWPAFACSVHHPSVSQHTVCAPLHLLPPSLISDTPLYPRPDCGRQTHTQTDSCTPSYPLTAAPPPTNPRARTKNATGHT